MCVVYIDITQLLKFGNMLTEIKLECVKIALFFFRHS